MTRVDRALRLAFAFLTILRIPIRDEEVTPLSLADARFAYPIVGLTLGLVLAGASEILRRAGVGVGVSAFWIVALAATLTGGLHLDGLADTADGLFLWGDPARRLAVMRDPHVGSFGVIGLVLILLGKFAAMQALEPSSRSTALLGMACVSRSLILVASGLAPYARPEGTGRVVIDATTRRDSIAAGALALVVGASLLGWWGLVASGLAVVVAIGMVRISRRKLAGITGDILGSVVELGDLAFLMVLAIRVG